MAVSLLLSGALQSPVAVRAATTTRIAVLETGGALKQQLYDPAQKAFEGELARSGFRPEDGLVITPYLLGDSDRANEKLIGDLARTHPDLVLTFGTDALERASRALTTMPVVYTMVFQPPPDDPPNMVGVTLNIPASQQFQELQGVDPGAKRVAVAYDPASAISGPLIRQARDAAPKMGLSLVEVPAASPGEAVHKLDGLRGQVDAIWMVPDNVSASANVLTWGHDHREPVMGLSGVYVEHGALLALFPDYRDIGVQAGEMAARILRGSTPASLVARGPRQTRLWINLDTARQLGITIPPAIQQTADRVISAEVAP